ncbi:MAG: FHA domain-containing protein [Sedimentisphaeraceae bacterium JB056]
MHIVIEKNGQRQEEFTFDNGPVYIGRQIGSKIFLPDLGISRQHAVLYNAGQDEWFVEDLDSANKTFVNDDEITKCRLVSGDVIKICDFTLTVEIEKDKKREPSIHLDDTIAHAHYELKTITRRLSNDDSPLVRISHQRVEQLRKNLSEIISFSDLDKLLEYGAKQLLRQMHAAHCWIGIFDENMLVTKSYGRNLDTTRLEFENISLKGQISTAVTEEEHILVPRILQPVGQNKNLRSAIITSFKLKNGLKGAAYIDNTREHEHYTIVDLDYLMLINTMLAAKIDSLI